MTIRGAILRGYLALVFAAVLASALLSFHQFRQSLQAEIARNLDRGAAALLERIDAFFFERLENMREWHRLEMLQDIRVGDVDKRLAGLLADLREDHGKVYRVIYCTDTQDRIVAASDAALIGRVRAPGAATRREENGRAAPVVLEELALGTGTPPRAVVLRIAIPDAFGGGRLGWLYAEIDIDELARLLADAVRDSARTALLLDADARVIGAAGPLAPPPGGALRDLAGPRSGHAGAIDERTLPELGGERLLLGAAESAGYQHFPGFGWRLLVVEPTAVAFRPVWRLAYAMAAVLLLTLALAGWASLRLSLRLARPIRELTEYTRTLGRQRPPRAPQIDGGVAEVGALCGAFGEMIDALERSREQLVRTGKLAVVGEMAATMAHEVRTPLGILKSSAQLLERQPGLTPQGVELTRFIAGETDRLNNLVTALLESASPRPPRFATHDLHAILRHVIALAATRADGRAIVLGEQLEADPCELRCDREQLIQLFLNLVLNAIQHLPAGGHVDLLSRRDGGVLEVRVEDDGPGVAPADRARVFDPFFTRREDGVGLGLAIVERIAQAHGGTITVGEGARGGASFVVRLPQSSEDPAR